MNEIFCVNEYAVPTLNAFCGICLWSPPQVMVMLKVPNSWIRLMNGTIATQFQVEVCLKCQSKLGQR